MWAFRTLKNTVSNLLSDRFNPKILLKNPATLSWLLGSIFITPILSDDFQLLYNQSDAVKFYR